MNNSLITKVSNILGTIGVSETFSINQLPGGRNNKVYCIKTKNDTFALKEYFTSFNDPRDRLKNEYSFLKFLWVNNIRNIAKPLALDKNNNLGLYSFIEGKEIKKNQITYNKIEKALTFFKKINLLKNTNEASLLPLGSEASLSQNDHINSFNWRYQQLKIISSSTKINREVIRFILGKLKKKKNAIFNKLESEMQKLGINKSKQIPIESRCVSPSDYGFHNVLITDKGELFFIDFEYAGWDDIAKFVCDYFCQPDFPIPISYFDQFCKDVILEHPYPETEYNRVKLLFPLHQLKWCCLLLNEFIPTASVRRQFADINFNTDEYKFRQLMKAIKLCDRIEV